MAAKRTPKETWKAIEAQAPDDAVEHFLALSDDEVDAELRAHGGDPEQIRKDGAALVKKLGATADRLAWQIAAAEGLAREQARVDARPPKYAGMSLAQLKELVAVAKKDPRFAQPVAVMFRNRKTEEASEDELRALLEEIDALAERKK